MISSTRLFCHSKKSASHTQKIQFHHFRLHCSLRIRKLSAVYSLYGITVSFKSACFTTIRNSTVSRIPIKKFFGDKTARFNLLHGIKRVTCRINFRAHIIENKFVPRILSGYFQYCPESIFIFLFTCTKYNYLTATVAKFLNLVVSYKVKTFLVLVRRDIQPIIILSAFTSNT